MQATASNAWSLGFPSRSALALLNDAPMMLDTPLTRMLHEHDKMINEAFSNVPTMKDMTNWDVKNQPRYEVITNNDQEFKVALDVPGMDTNDIHISLENENKILKVAGTRESKGDGYFFSSKFSQSFSIDPTVNVDKFSAQLDNGVLVIAAPKDVKKLESSVRKIPIMSSSSESSMKNDDSATLQVNNSAKKVDVVDKKETVTHI